MSFNLAFFVFEVENWNWTEVLTEESGWETGVMSSCCRVSVHGSHSDQRGHCSPYNTKHGVTKFDLPVLGNNRTLNATHVLNSSSELSTGRVDPRVV